MDLSALLSLSSVFSLPRASMVSKIPGLTGPSGEGDTDRLGDLAQFEIPLLHNGLKDSPDGLCIELRESIKPFNRGVGGGKPSPASGTFGPPSRRR